jgi:tripartite-type tricarboxylate transporter receptor subunit TctC
MRAIRSAALALIAIFFAVTCATSAWCQAYPNRTIQLIVAYAAGGTGDIVARSISDKLGAALGQTVVVENRAGASGAIGAHSVTPRLCRSRSSSRPKHHIRRFRTFSQPSRQSLR